jgi:subtilase-type serine protease
LRGSLGWRHAFGDVTEVARNAFAGGTAFTIDGVPLANNALAIQAGFDMALGGQLALSLGYTGQYAANARDNGIQGALRWSF